MPKQKKRKNSRVPNGVGSIRKRDRVDKKTGKRYIWYEGQIMVGFGKDGKPARRTVTGKTCAEVKQKMLAIQTSLNDHTYVDPNKLLLADWLEDWLQHYLINAVEGTKYKYRYDVEHYISPALGHIKLQKLNESDVSLFITSLKERGLAPKTIRCIHGVLHKALEKAKELKKLPVNVATGTELPKLKEPKLCLLDHTEAAALKVAAAGYKYERFFLLALYLGLREGELLGLNWSQINWKKHELCVDRQLVWNRDNPCQKFIAEPKYASCRTIVLAPSIERILHEQHFAVQEQRAQAGDSWIERGLVFPGPQGDFLSRQTVYDCLRRVAKKAGIKPLRVHDLRHIFAAFALEAGVDVRTVQGLLGHATPEFTLRVYAYVNDHMKKTAAKKIEVAIGLLEQIARDETTDKEPAEIVALYA